MYPVINKWFVEESKQLVPDQDYFVQIKDLLHTHSLLQGPYRQI